jgi:hypothetical protein
MAIANNFLSLSGNSQLIDHLIDFSRYQIVHTIFPAYDALYRQIHKGAGAGEDEGNMACFWYRILDLTSLLFLKC